MAHPWYPFGLHAFTMPGDGSCQHVGGPRDRAEFARQQALIRLSRRLGRHIHSRELDAGVWVMPEVQA